MGPQGLPAPGPSDKSRLALQGPEVNHARLRRLPGDPARLWRRPQGAVVPSASRQGCPASPAGLGGAKGGAHRREKPQLGAASARQSKMPPPVAMWGGEPPSTRPWRSPACQRRRRLVRPALGAARRAHLAPGGFAAAAGSCFLVCRPAEQHPVRVHVDCKNISLVWGAPGVAQSAQCCCAHPLMRHAMLYPGSPKFAGHCSLRPGRAPARATANPPVSSSVATFLNRRDFPLIPPCQCDT